MTLKAIQSGLRTFFTLGMYSANTSGDASSARHCSRTSLRFTGMGYRSLENKVHFWGTRVATLKTRVSPEVNPVCAECFDDLIEVRADLNVYIRDLCLVYMSCSPFLQCILELLGREEEVSHGGWDVLNYLSGLECIVSEPLCERKSA